MDHFSTTLPRRAKPAVLLWMLALCMLAAALDLAVLPRAFAQSFLPADRAFRADVQVADAHRLRVDFALARGVYLYRDRLEAKLDAGAAPLKWELPPGQPKHDPNFDKVMEIYHGDLTGYLDVPDTLRGVQTLTLVYQGCADAGLCYPPQKKHFRVTLDGRGALTGVEAVSAIAPLAATAADKSPRIDGAANGDGPDDTGAIAGALASGQLWRVIPVFLAAGLLLSLTPCVLPMVPILSSIIIGQKGGVSRGKGFGLALSYSQGMALVYTVLGVAAGLLGQGLAAYLQHPWVVLGFAALMVLLALSMFGLYELRLPASVQSWLGAGANRLPGGRLLSVFAMGVVSALVVSPCVSAPLAGALLYISQTHDVWLGGSALYAMAWGMSVPLLLVGLSAGTLLPRTGPWMTTVKTLFGVLMLAMAAWVARPAWPYLEHLAGAAPAGNHRSVLPFQPVRTVAELDAAVAQAAMRGKPVMLDFYADWCTSCIEMEKLSFSDPRVQVALKDAVLLQADVTDNSQDDRTLLARFDLFGPPGIIFFDPQGRPVPKAQVVGFQRPDVFLRSLRNAGMGDGASMP